MWTRATTEPDPEGVGDVDASAALAARKLTVRFGTRVALSEVSFVLAPGLTVLLGANGAGKSTLLEVLAGLRRPSEGALLRAGRVVQKRSDRRLRADLGYVPQNPHLAPRVTCAETLAYAAWLKRIRTSDQACAIGAALEKVGLANRAQDRVATLSGGMRRRLAIATALVSNPSIVLLDEPAAGLDLAQRAILRTVIGQICAAGAVIVSTHNVSDVAEIADNVLILDEGHVSFTGSMTQLCGKPHPAPSEIEAAYLRVTHG